MKKLILGFLGLFLVQFSYGQENELERLRKEQEAFQQQQQKEEKAFQEEQEKQLQELYQEYLEYEKEREQLVLEFLGKNVDEKLREKAEKMEKVVPRDVSFLSSTNPQAIVTQLNVKAEELAKATATQESETVREEKSSVELPDTLVNVQSPAQPDSAKKTVVTQSVEKEAEPLKEETAATTVNDSIMQQEIAANRPIFVPLKEGDYRISSHYNKNRLHPTLKTVRPHNGIDLAAPTGTPIYASADGLIEIAQYSKSAGNWILLNHRNGYKTKYFHMNKLVAKPGMKVKRGELIGYVGSTGYSSGPHLHYEIRKNNIPTDPINYLITHL